MKIYLASDHAGFELKSKLFVYLMEAGHDVEDLGARELNPDDDYPEYISKAAEAVSHDPSGTRAVIFGGSGQGEAIVANRFKGVRAIVYYGAVLAKGPVDISGNRSADPFEIVRLSRVHNNANVLSIGARFVTDAEAKEVVRLWLAESFSGDERHARRIAKIDSFPTH